MKAEELMIGDWVMWSTPHGDKRPVNLKDFARIYLAAFECEPIPLTEEILKANGLDPITYCDLSMPKWFMSIRSGNNHVEMPFRYVHELQHALRLCGLNDLADNFKV